MKAILLAGGKGIRLSPYTKVIPKPLMPIGDRPILEVLLLQIQRAGIHQVVITVGHMAQLIASFFQNGKNLGLDIQYSYEAVPLGTAGPLALIDGLSETFLVSNGDVLTTLNIRDLLAFHKEQKATATIAMHHRQVHIDLGVIQLDDGPDITGYIEKPNIDYMVSMGIYVFEPQVLNFIPPGKYLDFPDLVKKLLAAGEKVVGYHFDGYWQDLGRPDDYEQATLDFDEMRYQFFPEESI